jgi:ADP-heptose:LPS heptosyltransferase
VLAIHPGALGDVLLAVPALRALRRRLPRDARLTLGAQPRIAELLSTLGVVDCGVAFDALGLDRLFVDEPPPPRTQALARWKGCVCWFAARDAVFTRQLRALVPDAIVASPTGETGLVWRHLLATVGATDEEGREPLSVPTVVEAAAREVLEHVGLDTRRPLVLVHPGAGGRSKCWPAAGFAAIVATLRRSGVATVVHQGPASPDAEAVEQVLAALDESVPVLREPSLLELAGALAHAGGYIGNDSGISHLASALGTPSLVLFTPPYTRWSPWAVEARTLVVTTDRVDTGDLAEVLGHVAELLT